MVFHRIDPFPQNHYVLYLPNSYKTVKLAYNHSMSHNNIICNVKVKTWIYHAWYSIYAYTRYINATYFVLTLYHWITIWWNIDILLHLWCTQAWIYKTNNYAWLLICDSKLASYSYIPFRSSCLLIRNWERNLLY